MLLRKVPELRKSHIYNELQDHKDQLISVTSLNESTLVLKLHTMFFFTTRQLESGIVDEFQKRQSISFLLSQSVKGEQQNLFINSVWSHCEWM